MAKQTQPLAAVPETDLYVVTKNAPPYVNGKRVSAGETLTLTELQARYELQLGHIEPKVKPVAPAASKID